MPICCLITTISSTFAFPLGSPDPFSSSSHRLVLQHPCTPEQQQEKAAPTRTQRCRQPGQGAQPLLREPCGTKPASNCLFRLSPRT